MSYYRWYAAWGPGTGAPPPTPPTSPTLPSSDISIVEFDGDVTEEFGAITVSGGWVLPAPKIPSAYESVNRLLRSKTDRTFRWQAVVQPPNLPLGLDYKQAFAYRLEITPDLGHQNPDLLFEPYDASQKKGNPRLKVFDFLLPDVELTATIDHLTYEISQEDWDRIINPPFERYFWRVTALTAEGVPGFPSDFSSFEVQTEVRNSDWDIVDTPVPEGFIQVITGTRGTEISQIQVLGHSPSVIYPTPTTWRLEVPVRSIKETLFVRAKDKAGNTSAYKAVPVALETSTPEDWNLWNTFDELGLMVGAERYDGEKNADFKKRILDHYTRRRGVTYPGMRSALARVFGFIDTQEDRALIIRKNIRAGQDQSFTQVAQMMIGSREISVWGEQFRAQLERHIVDGNSWSIKVDRNMEDFEPKVESPIGNLISPAHYAVENRENRIRFLTPQYNNKEVHVTYNYRETVSLADKTLAQIKTELEAIQIDGVSVLGVTVKSGLESKSAEGLEQILATPVLEIEYFDTAGLEVVGLPVRWSPVRLFALQDGEFQDSFLNEFGNLFNTAIDAYAEQLRALAGQTWGFLVADKALFINDEELEGQAGLPTTLDIPYGFYQSSKTGRRYDYHQFIALGGADSEDGSALILVGVADTLLKSGVGSQKDLLVTVKQKNATALETPTAESPVVQLVASSLQELDDSGSTGSGTLDPTEYGS